MPVDFEISPKGEYVWQCEVDEAAVGTRVVELGLLEYVHDVDGDGDGGDVTIGREAQTVASPDVDAGPDGGLLQRQKSVNQLGVSFYSS